MASIDSLINIAKISKYTGFTSLCYFLNRNKKRTIAYHNVIPDKYWCDSLHLDHSMKESNFIRQIEIMKNKFNIDLDVKNTKTLTLTFDDGYYNQCNIASKIMDKNNIQGYFFCVSNLINNNEILTMDKLQYWFSCVPFGTYEYEKFNLELKIKDEVSRRVEWKKVSDLLKKGISVNEAEECLNKLFNFKKLNLNSDFYKLRFKAIEKVELEEMKKKGHKIGAHSANHIRLSDLKTKELEEDIRICGDMIKKNIYNTNIFCYPYGSIEDISDEVIYEVKKNNFSSAFAYSNSPLKHNKNYNEYFMPRIFLPDSGNEALVDFIISGAKHLIAFKKLLP